MNNVTSKSRHEVPAAAGIAGREKSNCSDGTRPSVTFSRPKCRLDIIPKIEASKVVIIRRRTTGNQSGRADRGGYAIVGGKLVAKFNTVGDCPHHHSSWIVGVWKTMDMTTGAISGSAHSTFNFAYMLIYSYNVKKNWTNVISNAFKFIVGIDLGHGEASRCV